MPPPLPLLLRASGAMPKVLRAPSDLWSKDLSGQVFVITGASGGIGAFCARRLVEMGATVVLAGRKGTAAVAESITSGGELVGKRSVALGPHGGGKVGSAEGMDLDLSDLASVRAFAAAFLARHTRLDCLINNAGVMMPPYGKTKDGFEMQLGVNHLGHFLLTLLLKDVLEKSAPSRVVCVASCSACQCTMMCPSDPYIDYDDINWESREYEKDLAYGQSKLANILHAREIPKRFNGVTAYSLHPGWVQTQLMRHAIPSACLRSMMQGTFKRMGKMISVDDGSQTSLWVALADPSQLENGAFYSQSGIYKDKASQKGGWPMAVPNPNDTDAEAAKLWDWSVKALAGAVKVESERPGADSLRTVAG